MTTVYTMDEVAKHNSEGSCWLVIHGNVYDVTKFLDQHPGGEEVMIDASGRDASADFDDVAHSPEAVAQMKDYLIGTVAGYTGPKPKAAAAANKGNASKSDSDSSSFVTTAIFGVVLAAAAYYFFMK